MPLPSEFASLCALQVVPEEDGLPMQLVQDALKAAREEPGTKLGDHLACAFDFLVAVRFHNVLKPENWLWCPQCGLDIHPILNACPACSLEERFVHFHGNKPGSGVIGPVTSASLRDIIASLFQVRANGSKLVFACREPADLLLADVDRRAAFFCEVKAAPLFTPPCALPHQSDFSVERTLPHNHRVGIMRQFHTLDVSLFVPDRGTGFQLVPLASGPGSFGWAERGFIEALRSDPGLFPLVSRAWRDLWGLYRSKGNDDPRYWFTGGCGRPRNPGEGWPTDGKGRPQGSISDGKTSVGMDRTDDIKKSTFQVLKLGVEHRSALERSGWDVGIGLLGNLPAARHYEHYLSSYENVVWSRTEAGKTPPGWSNLFDAVASFTDSRIRSAFLADLLDFD